MSLTNLLKYIEAITLLLPLIDNIVSMVERLFDEFGGGRGVAKKEAAKGLVVASLKTSGVDVPEEMMNELIDTVVKIKNETGEFKKAVSVPIRTSGKTVDP